MATPAPDGTAWAREIHAFAAATSQTRPHGAGAHQVVLRRHRRRRAGDRSSASGASSSTASPRAACCACALAPSMRVMRVLGLFQSRDESTTCSAGSSRRSTRSSARRGFVNLGDVGFGPDSSFRASPCARWPSCKQAQAVGLGPRRRLGSELTAHRASSRAARRSTTRRAHTTTRAGRRLHGGADGGAGVSVVGAARNTVADLRLAFCSTLHAHRQPRVRSAAARRAAGAVAPRRRSCRCSSRSSGASRTTRSSAGCSPSRG